MNIVGGSPGRGKSWWRRQSVRNGLIALGSFVLVTAVFSAITVSRLDGGDDAPPRSTTMAPVGAEVTPPSDSGAGHAHSGPTVVPPPLAAAEQSALDEQLTISRSAVPGSTVADALAAGYEISNSLEGDNDVHLVNRAYLDAPFDPARPSELLAGGRGDDDPILAAVYLIPSDSPAPPDGFAGGRDQWHHHEGMVCDGVPDDTPTSEARCAAAGGRWQFYRAWMLHAWVVPGVGNADGVFVAENQCVRTGATCPAESPD